MIPLMVVRVLLPNPALEIRDVALKVSHYLRPYKPLLLDEGFLAPPLAEPLVFIAAPPLA